MRRFELHRDEDVSGISGTGVVAEGVAFSDGGPVALRWTSEWPTSVVFHDRGVESLEAVHGHNGRTRIVWLDPAASETNRQTDTSRLSDFDGGDTPFDGAAADRRLGDMRRGADAEPVRACGPYCGCNDDKEQR